MHHSVIIVEGDAADPARPRHAPPEDRADNNDTNNTSKHNIYIYVIYIYI